MMSHTHATSSSHDLPASAARRPSWPCRARRLVAGATLLLLTGAAAGLVALHLTVSDVAHAPPPATDGSVSVAVLDRDDRLLRAFTTASGHWRLPVDPADVDPRYVAMLTAFEDQRFHHHGGVDGLALARAAVQLLTHGRIVSGGSTLTMQTARLVRGPQARGLGVKLGQIVDALRLERQIDKRRILARYLELAPFGGNMEGVRAAAIAYFGKEPWRLSAAEAALLVAIPQAPEARRPDRFPDAARRARDRVLARAEAAGILSAAERARAVLEPVPTVRRPFPQSAPHLAEALRTGDPAAIVHRTTLDRDLQTRLETLARDHVQMLGERLSAAIVVADHRTGEILARVGSAGYLDASRWGPIDMVDAVRSPGSTLKPLIYGLGFEAGLAHPETLIEDRPIRFGNYRPRNFDEDFHGTITVRDALARSLNIPAVKVLAATGPARLYARLRRAGTSPELPAGTEPTLAMALGGLGMTLHDLATLYAGLARGGEPIALTHTRARRSVAIGPASRRAAAAIRPPRLLSQVAAWYVTDILRDAPPPAHARAGRIPYKTGTSYGYRDAYAIGYDGRHVVAVWVGRPDSAATPGLLGRTAAAPLLFDAFARISPGRAPTPPAPAGTVHASGADLPPPLKRFREPWADAAPTPTGPYLTTAPVISFPADRSEIDLADILDGESLVLRAEGGALPLTWLVDDAAIPSEPFRRDVEWRPPGRGFVHVSVVDATGRADRVVVRLR
jgi:penicillin-binding protein 1C